MMSSPTAGGDPEPASASPRRILLVEDDFLIAEAYRTLVEGFGFAVIGPSATVRAALTLLDSQIPDAALLDVTVSGSAITPVAERLVELDRPFVFLTGAPDLTQLPEHLRHAGLLSKSSTPDVLRRALDSMLARQR